MVIEFMQCTVCTVLRDQERNLGNVESASRLGRVCLEESRDTNYAYFLKDIFEHLAGKEGCVRGEEGEDYGGGRQGLVELS